MESAAHQAKGTSSSHLKQMVNGKKLSEEAHSKPRSILFQSKLGHYSWTPVTKNGWPNTWVISGWLTAGPSWSCFFSLPTVCFLSSEHTQEEVSSTVWQKVRSFEMEWGSQGCSCQVCWRIALFVPKASKLNDTSLNSLFHILMFLLHV